MLTAAAAGNKRCSIYCNTHSSVSNWKNPTGPDGMALAASDTLNNIALMHV